VCWTRHGHLQDGITVPIEAVTFDFWNTIGVEPSGSYRRRVTECVDLLGTAGFAAEPVALEAWFGAAVEVWIKSWRAGQHYSAEQGAHDCARELGLDLPAETLSAMAAALGSADVDAFSTPNIGTCLRALKERGIRLGVICDTGFSNGLRVRSALTKFGFLELFDHLTFSDEVGAFKPAPAPFADAMAGLGVDDPQVMAHIGDTHRTDVMGAMQAGWTAVRYAGIVDDPGAPDATLIVKDHADLPAALGLC
jgi:putative hydrolase of the HAD superfamily